MKLSVRVVFFDLGNTLIYDKELWEDFYRRADRTLWESLRGFGVDSSPRELYGGYKTLFHYYYNLRENELEERGMANVLQQLLDAHKMPLPAESIKAALRAMYAVTQTNWQPEEDAVPTLETLKQRGYRLGMISNGADDENTYVLLDKGKFRPYFEYVLTSAACGKRKPHPDIFRMALEHFQVPPEQTVMVGDTFEADIVGAKRMGMSAIWITRRLRETANRQEIQPDASVSALSEVPPLLSMG
jgi:putative hydrolase of the HAD superfamily